MKLLDTPEEERFKRITRLVRQHFRASASSITLVDRERQFFLARDGLPNREGPRCESVCSLVVEAKDPMVITDLSKNRRTQDFHSLIVRLNLLFYAGVPLFDPEGWPVGALCVLDHVPRRFSEDDLRALLDFAAITEDELAIRRADEVTHELIDQVEKLRMRAFVDPLTGVWNRGALFDLLSREIERARRTDESLSVTMLDLDRFKSVNDTYGHAVGDDVLREVCRRIKLAIRAYDGLGRYGGEEFMVLFPSTDTEMAIKQAERVREAVRAEPCQLGEDQRTITVSLGVATLQDGETQEQLIERADKALYRAKENGRDRVEAG